MRRNKGRRSSKMACNDDQRVKVAFRFFKIILPSILDNKMLRIPETFAKKYGNQIPGVATLTVPTGVAWKIAVMEKENHVYFGEGWDTFMELNHISYGYFLEFEYLEDAHFSVHIFDLSCCEIDYPRTNDRTCPGEDDADDDKANKHQQSEIEVKDDLVGWVFDGSNVSFSIVVRAVHVISKTKNYPYLEVPRSFEKKYKMRGSWGKFVKLQVDDGREWCVRCYILKRCLRLTGAEWVKFIKDNNWQIEEMYTFRIARGDNDCLVFHVLKA